MEQTFSDLLDEPRPRANDRALFVLRTFVETSAGAVRENWTEYNMRDLTTNPRLAALAGLLCLLPFLIMNWLVGSQYQPLLSFLRPNGHTGSQEIALLVAVLLLILAGAMVAASPMFRSGPDSQRHVRVLNLVVSLLLLLLFVGLASGLGAEVYRCDILGIPQCD